MIRVFAFLFSVIMHIILALALLYQPVKHPLVEKPGDNVPKPVTVTLLPKEASITTEEVSSDIGKTRYPTDDIICKSLDKNYKGIGIIHSITSPYVILHAPKFYPGYIAGLREGDLVLNPNARSVNEYLDIEIFRMDYGTMKFHVKTDTICFNEE